MNSENNIPKLTLLFGYFYKEFNGSEVILVKQTSNKWKFPILTEFDASNKTVDKAIDDAIMDFCKTSNVFILSDFLAFGIHLPEVRKIYIGPSPFEDESIPEEREAYFFKVKISEDYSGLSQGYKWEQKNQIFTIPEICDHKIELSAINRNFIYMNYGYKVLECVDILVFRKNQSKIEFLMLKREDRVRGFVGWEYPKGGIQYHETIFEGALHRLKAETGVYDYIYRGYLGYQTVDVSDRGLVEYNALKVHGLTYEFIGNIDEIQPVEAREIMRNPTWVSWEDAREMVWMKRYGPVFFDKWKQNELDIISGNFAEKC